jgi:hypothetical protein
VNGTLIVTGDANACPCGVNEKTSLSAVRESGGASLATATVIDVGASSAPAGTTTLAPPADTVPPAGPIEAVDEVAAEASDGASGGEPSWDEFDAGDDEHAANEDSGDNGRRTSGRQTRTWRIVALPRGGTCQGLRCRSRTGGFA